MASNLGICGNKTTSFCSMEQKEGMGHSEIGIDFLIWDVGLSLNIGESAYDDCDKYGDGTPCLMGSSCNNCLNPASKSILHSCRTIFVLVE